VFENGAKDSFGKRWKGKNPGNKRKTKRGNLMRASGRERPLSGLDI